jgi:hypothetical protein
LGGGWGRLCSKGGKAAILDEEPRIAQDVKLLHLGSLQAFLAMAVNGQEADILNQ